MLCLGYIDRHHGKIQAVSGCIIQLRLDLGYIDRCHGKIELMLDLGYMGQNDQDGKYALSVSLFVTFHGDLESKLAIGGPIKKYPVDKYTRRVMAWLCFYGKWAQFNKINN